MFKFSREVSEHVTLLEQNLYLVSSRWYWTAQIRLTNFWKLEYRPHRWLWAGKSEWSIRLLPMLNTQRSESTSITTWRRCRDIKWAQILQVCNVPICNFSRTVSRFGSQGFEEVCSASLLPDSSLQKDWAMKTGSSNFIYHRWSLVTLVPFQPKIPL